MIMLDTCACIDFLNGNENLKKLVLEEEELIYITTISVYEVNIGLDRTKRKISEIRYNELYKIWLDFIKGVEIYSLGLKEAEKAAEIYDQLEAKGQLIDDNDILISGIMLTNGIKKIITKNLKHYKNIEGIEIINY